MKTFKDLFMVSIISVFLLVPVVNAGDHPEISPPPSSKELQQMKNLVGTWEGTQSMGKPDEKIQVKYTTTAGGTAVVETLFPGTAHEMVTVYHDENGKLVMTHYCMIGNQPKMMLKNADDMKFTFDFATGNTIEVSKEPHMHALDLSFNGKDSLTHFWTFYDAGKKANVNEIKLTRIQ